MKDSFIFYRSFYESIKELDDESKLKVLNAICELGLNAKEIDLDGVSKALFILIKPQIKANQKRYENGKKGGRPKKPKDNQKETKKKPKHNLDKTKPKPNVNVNGNVNGNYNENENNNDNDLALNFSEKDNLLNKNDLLVYFNKKFNCNFERDDFLSFTARFGEERVRDNILRMERYPLEYFKTPVGFLKQSLLDPKKQWSLKEVN